MAHVEPDLGTLPLATLQAQCTAERARYQRTRNANAESVHCVEIVRRAAATDAAALTALLELSHGVVSSYCPADLRPAIEDLQQEVLIRLHTKFRNAASPYRVDTFAAYLAFVRVITVHVASDMRRSGIRHGGHASLDGLREIGVEPASPPMEERVEQRHRFDRYLALLPDPTMRAVFYRRFALEETPDAIAQALDIPKNTVFRLTEQAIRVLAQQPEVRELLEAG